MTVLRSLSELREHVRNEAPITRDDGTQSEDQAAAPTCRPYAVEFAAGAD